MKFAILGDLHLGRKKVYIYWLSRLYLPRSPQMVVGTETDKRLQNLVEKVNLSSIDFVVSIGDLTESMTPDQVQRIRKIMKELKVPWVPVMGNHDLWSYGRNAHGRVKWHTTKPLTFPLFKRAFFKEFSIIPKFFKDYQEQGGNLCNFSFIYNDIKFIIVDNSDRGRFPLGFPGSNGRGKLYSKSKQWLQEQLNTAETNIVTISHFPLQVKIKSARKVILTISGHRHKYKVVCQNNIISLVTNALYVNPWIPTVTAIPEKGFSVNIHSV